MKKVSVFSDDAIIHVNKELVVHYIIQSKAA